MSFHPTPSSPHFSALYKIVAQSNNVDKVKETLTQAAKQAGLSIHIDHAPNRYAAMNHPEANRYGDTLTVSTGRRDSILSKLAWLDVKTNRLEQKLVNWAGKHLMKIEKLPLWLKDGIIWIADLALAVKVYLLLAPIKMPMLIMALPHHIHERIYSYGKEKFPQGEKLLEMSAHNPLKMDKTKILWGEESFDIETGELYKKTAGNPS